MFLHIRIPLTSDELRFYNTIQNTDVSSHEYSVFTEMISSRVTPIVMSTLCLERKQKLPLHVRDVKEKTSLVVIILNTSSQSLLTKPLFSGRRFAQIIQNDGKDIWDVWFQYENEGDSDKDRNVVHNEYKPFITYDDYKTFDENNDDLDRCIASFHHDFPTFLRKGWNVLNEEEIKEIEKSNSPIETFNRIIKFPSYAAKDTLDEIFSYHREYRDSYADVLDILTEDTLQVLGYFYDVHFNAVRSKKKVSTPFGTRSFYDRD